MGGQGLIQWWLGRQHVSAPAPVRALFTSHSNSGFVNGWETAVGESVGKSWDRESIVTERWGLKDHSREVRRRGEQKPQGRKSAPAALIAASVPVHAAFHHASRRLTVSGL